MYLKKIVFIEAIIFLKAFCEKLMKSLLYVYLLIQMSRFFSFKQIKDFSLIIIGVT